MSLTYTCLILDHDDTSVKSTATVHYPAHRESMRHLRPDHRPIDLEGWFLKNFHPGVMAYLTDELALTQAELEVEYRIWREFTTSRTPEFFEGIPETLIRYREAGGLIAVVSHSEKDVIARHYRAHPDAARFFPDCIFGWDYDAAKRKPSTWPVDQILSTYGLRREEVLILDDLKPGVLMSQAAAIPIAAAGWGHDIPQIREYMERNCIAYCRDVGEFQRLLMC